MVNRLVRDGVEGTLVVVPVEDVGRMVLPAPRRMRRGVVDVQRERTIGVKLRVEELEGVVGDDIGDVAVWLVEGSVLDHGCAVVVAAAFSVDVPVVESKLRQRGASEMPLTAQSTGVAVLGEDLDIGPASAHVLDLDAVPRRMSGVALSEEVLDSVLGRYLAGENGGASGESRPVRRRRSSRT